MDRLTCDTLLSEVLAARRAVVDRSPLIQCITNRVVPQVTADVLLAVGASPAMVDTVPEAGEFAAVASGVLVNVGTVDDATGAAMRAAVAAANGPWVLDPVAVGALKYRTALACELLDAGPAAVRGNASEIRALAGDGPGGRGVDTVDDVASALPAAKSLAGRSGAVVGVSGAADLIVAADGRGVRVHAGHPLLTRVIGTGCALGALVAAYLSAWEDPFVAVVAAHAHTGAAGGVAGGRASGPGSFAVAWIDALYSLDDAALAAHCRFEPLGEGA